jgi:hypothetical protein
MSFPTCPIPEIATLGRTRSSGARQRLLAVPSAFVSRGTSGRWLMRFPSTAARLEAQLPVLTLGRWSVDGQRHGDVTSLTGVQVTEGWRCRR